MGCKRDKSPREGGRYQFRCIERLRGEEVTFAARRSKKMILSGPAAWGIKKVRRKNLSVRATYLAGEFFRPQIWAGPRWRSWRRWSRPSRALSLLVQNLARNRHSQFGERGVVSIDEQQTFIGAGVHFVGIKGDSSLVPVALRSALPFQLQSR